MLMCKGFYVILQDRPSVEKPSNVTFISIIWSLGFSLKGDVKTYFL